MNANKYPTIKRTARNPMGFPPAVLKQVKALIRLGEASPVGSQAAVLAYYLRNEADIRGAECKPVGCTFGFRKAARFSSKAELKALQVGEDWVGFKAMVAAGLHPAYVTQEGRD